MKMILRNLALTGMFIFSVSAFAEDKIVITGEPVVLEQQNGMYKVPADYTATTPYHYVMVDNQKWVCYADKQPNLATLKMVSLDVMMAGEEKMVWNCYEFNPAYFEVKSTM